MDSSVACVLPIFLFLPAAVGLAVALVLLANLLNPNRLRRVEPAPYESGMDPVHDTHRRFDVRFYLLAIAFLVFDVELLFLYPWAVAWQPGGSQEAQWHGNQAGRLGDKGSLVDTARARKTRIMERVGREGAEREGRTDRLVSSSPALPLAGQAFPGAMVFLALLMVGFVYDWRKGVFQWR